MEGISKHTKEILEYLSLQDFIKEYTLVGGTALSIQINNRISEDLDFCIWQKNITSGKLYEIKWFEIEQTLKQKFESVSTDILDLQQVNFLSNDVRITFFVRENVDPRIIQTGEKINKLKVASIDSIGAMKLELLLRRNSFRDYYDIFSILKEGYSFLEILDKAVIYSSKRLKIKSILSILAKAEQFRKEKNFHLLNPVYDINEISIRDYILKKYKEETEQGL